MTDRALGEHRRNCVCAVCNARRRADFDAERDAVIERENLRQHPPPWMDSYCRVCGQRSGHWAGCPNTPKNAARNTR